MTTHTGVYSREARYGLEGYWRVTCGCGFSHGGVTRKGAQGWMRRHKKDPQVVCPILADGFGTSGTCDEHGEIVADSTQVPADSGR